MPRWPAPLVLTLPCELCPYPHRPMASDAAPMHRSQSLMSLTHRLLLPSGLRGSDATSRQPLTLPPAASHQPSMSSSTCSEVVFP
ncbi:hypothetical protein GUJ93_ZPchr0002g24988 [Zizania palustris]|uniref:Uncharacterized protein n=1 Tax=Zizania palustris TaxID=103762 RepID=A0A8J5VWD2_ZIZPA|nr:hypothetical protein GUJ93_ZPchr0002g24988 [Zizania palustris]